MYIVTLGSDDRTAELKVWPIQSRPEKSSMKFASELKPDAADWL